MKASFYLTLLLLIGSCSQERNDSREAVAELYSLDPNELLKKDHCFYLQVFDEKCQDDCDSDYFWRLSVTEVNNKTYILRVEKLKERGYLVVNKEIAAGFDNLFIVNTHNLPIRYHQSKRVGKNADVVQELKKIQEFVELAKSIRMGDRDYLYFTIESCEKGEFQMFQGSNPDQLLKWLNKESLQMSQ